MTDIAKHIIFTILIGGLVAMLLLGIVLLSPKLAGADVDTSKAVIHHTASPCWTTVQDIDRWHKERGWDGIGYHFVIKCDGTIEKGRSLHKQGAHAKGRNNRLGIVLVGYDEFTNSQIVSLKKLLSDFGVLDIERHHKECPGEGLDVETLIAERKN